MMQLVATWQPGKLLVKFFGEHSSMWVSESQLEEWGGDQDEPRLHNLVLWGRQKHRQAASLKSPLHMHARQMALPTAVPVAPSHPIIRFMGHDLLSVASMRPPQGLSLS